MKQQNELSSSDIEILNRYDYALSTQLTDEQQKTLSLMVAHQDERLEGYNTEIIKKWFPITELTTPAIVGTYSISEFGNKHKWIQSQYARNIGGKHFCTPGDIARDYLAVKFPKRKPRITTGQYKSIIMVRRNPPLFCQPGNIEQGYYVDIQSAYWSILRVGGWDIDYAPGRFIAMKSDVNDFPVSWDKLTRNTLVTSGIPSPLNVWTGKTFKPEHRPTKYINLVLWAFVQDVLNGVADDAIAAGARYCFTDGFIVGHEKLMDVIQAIEAWGLPVGIKAEGYTEIKAVGNYRVGDYKTKRFNLTDRKTSISKIHPVHKEWLKHRFVRFAEYRNRT